MREPQAIEKSREELALYLYGHLKVLYVLRLLQGFLALPLIGQRPIVLIVDSTMPGTPPCVLS